MRIVADTNILVSAFISKGNEFNILEVAGEGRIKIVLSKELFEEFKGVIRREKFGFSFEKAEELIKQVSALAEIISSSEKLDIIKEDSDDNKVLESAVDGKAHYIVTGDEHLLKLKNYQNIKIINSKEFLDLFNKIKTKNT